MLFANAIFQWVPDHLAQLKRLLSALPVGGALAVQMPDNMDEPSHVMMREVARLPQFHAKLSHVAEARDHLPNPGVYYDALKPLCARFDIWHTVYNHVLADAAAIVEWVKGTGLRPFIDPLTQEERAEFIARYQARVTDAYTPTADGKVLLRFPRLFMVAQR